jgi:hypothetical protein
MAMTPASSVADFVAAPVERYWLGAHHIVFCRSPSLLGHVTWGKPDADESRELLEACTIGVREGAARHVWFGDPSRLELIALHEAKTTYRAELSAFQLDRAQSMLRTMSSSLTSIAIDVGFSSLQHFATAFRRATGETPSAFRARHRAAAA